MCIVLTSNSVMAHEVSDTPCTRTSWYQVLGMTVLSCMYMSRNWATPKTPIAQMVSKHIILYITNNCNDYRSWLSNETSL